MSDFSQANVPPRTSSWAAIEQRQLTLKQSRSELKRKLSSVSFDAEPIKHTRLRMEDVEAQRDEERLQRSWLDIEKENKNMNDKEYRRNVKESNQRIVSLGQTLWQESQRLRKLEEDMGKVAELGPDSKGAFVSTLLALYHDPTQSMERSHTAQSKMKAAAVQVYEARKDAPAAKKLWCAISRGWFDDPYVIAGHIVPRKIGPEAFDYVMGSGAGSRLDTADNCLLMHFSVERAFDNGNFVLIPADPTETPIKRWKIQITNQSAINTDMGRSSLKELDGKEVQFKNSNRPAARFLYFHFVITLLRNKRDRQPGWERFMVDLPTGKPFATMGPYLRKSMLLTLAKAAGDLDEEYEASVLGSEGAELFTEKEKLSDREEEEIARRALLAYDDETDQEVGKITDELGDLE